MTNRWLMIAAINGLLAGLAGAFGAHLLRTRLSADELQTFEVGVRYQMYHALALAVCAWFMSSHPSRLATAAAWGMFIGILLFSGSLYGLTLLKWKWLGPITPIGGLMLMAGWLFLALAAQRAGRQAVRV